MVGRIQALALAASLAGCGGGAAASGGSGGGSSSSSFAILDPANFSAYLDFGGGDGGGALDEGGWARAHIPFFETDDEDFTRAYYFRWHMFHSHMNASGWTDPQTGQPRFLITEFTGVDKSHSGSAGHHIMEARWLRDPACVKDYVQYWADGASRAYTYWYSHAAFEAYKVLAPGPESDGWLAGMYGQLAALYEQSFIDSPHLVRGDGTNGMQPGQRCFFKLAGWDAEENSISGDGCRPLSNACAAGEALGMGRIAGVANGSAAEAARWQNYSAIFTAALTKVLWNHELETFSVLNVPKPGCNATPGSRAPCFPGGAPKNATLSCTSPDYSEAACDALAAGGGGSVQPCGQVHWPPNSLTKVRELQALSTPWMLGLFDHDRAGAATYAKAWRALNAPGGFDAEWGPRTAERGHPCYNYTRWRPVVGPGGRGGRHDDNWNGPSWPFETSKLLTGYANLLNVYGDDPAVLAAANVSAANFAQWLRRYVYSHTRAGMVSGPAALGQNGSVPWVGENLHPDDGYWLSRYLRFRQNCSAAKGPPGPGGGQPGCNMDALYNHSSFIDLIISALVGLRAAAHSLLVSINPLVDPAVTKYFALDSLRYKGHDLAIAFDRDGSGRYAGKGCLKGVCLWVDGKLVASRPTLGKLTHQL
eukprot:SAG22_NODE_1493_length_4303_cov_2.713606_2_plen_648_part_00